MLFDEPRNPGTHNRPYEFPRQFSWLVLAPDRSPVMMSAATMSSFRPVTILSARVALQGVTRLGSLDLPQLTDPISARPEPALRQ